MKSFHCLLMRHRAAWFGLALAAAPLAPALAQSVGIGTAVPDASAALDVRSSGQGLLVPRLTAAQRLGIAAPATGLLVYQTNGGAQAGFWFNAGTAAVPGWTFINPTAPAPDNLGNHTATTNVNLQANALTGTGADLGTAVGLGVRADGGLNLGQNTPGLCILLGFQAGANTTTGNFNQFLGYQSGLANTSGSSNYFSGLQSGLANTSGDVNHFEGYQSGLNNTTGRTNFFAGYQAGRSNTTSSANQFVGYQSGFTNTTGDNNHFVGYQSGLANTTGRLNHFEGIQSGVSNITGSQNQFCGFQSGANNTTGSTNLFVGFQSGFSNITGAENFFGGNGAGISNTTGSQNTFCGGRFCGAFNTTGGGNVFVGYGGGSNNSNGGNNVFVGLRAGSINSSGNCNLALGYEAGPTTGGLTNAAAIGCQARVSQSNSLVLGATGTNAVNVGIGTTAPLVALHVVGRTLPGTSGAFSFFTPGVGTLTVVNNNQPTGQPVAGYFEGQLWATNAVVCGQLNVASDARLKTVLGRSNNAADLVLLNRLRITDYQMRDRAAYGSQRFKKVIAQEVEAVFPQAISRRRGFLPDVYQLVDKAEGLPGDSLVRLAVKVPAGGAAVGQRLKLVLPSGAEVVAPVARVGTAGTQGLVVRRVAGLEGATQLFAFGLEHADVRAVDYEALSMLNISATQELARRLAAAETQSAALEKQAATTRASVEQRLQALEANGARAEGTR